MLWHDEWVFLSCLRCFCSNHFFDNNVWNLRELWAQAGQVQGLGDVLEIEENLVPGDDGVKIQERKSQGKSSDEFRIPVNVSRIYYIFMFHTFVLSTSNSCRWAEGFEIWSVYSEPEQVRRWVAFNVKRRATICIYAYICVNKLLSSWCLFLNVLKMLEIFFKKCHETM